MWLYNIFSYMLYNMLYTLHNISQRCNISQPSRCSATGSHTQAGISIHILSPKMLQKFPSFLPKISPFWRPQVGIESVSEMANIFSVFYTKIFPVSNTLFIPISETLFIPVSDTLFIPVSDTLFIPIPFLSTFLFPPFPEPFLTPPPMQPCTHIQCPVPNVRIGHNSEQLECIPHL